MNTLDFQRCQHPRNAQGKLVSPPSYRILILRPSRICFNNEARIRNVVFWGSSYLLRYLIAHWSHVEDIAQNRMKEVAATLHTIENKYGGSVRYVLKLVENITRLQYLSIGFTRDKNSNSITRLRRMRCQEEPGRV